MGPRMPATLGFAVCGSHSPMVLATAQLLKHESDACHCLPADPVGDMSFSRLFDTARAVPPRRCMDDTATAGAFCVA